MAILQIRDGRLFHLNNLMAKLSGQGSLRRTCDERLSSFFLLDLHLSENEAMDEIQDEI